MNMQIHGKLLAALEGVCLQLHKTITLELWNKAKVSIRESYFKRK